MRTLYLECNMGAAGDMLAAALLELHPEPEAVLERLNHLGLPGVSFQKERAVSCGITGTHFSVRVNGVEEESQDVEMGHEQEGHLPHHEAHIQEKHHQEAHIQEHGEHHQEAHACGEHHHIQEEQHHKEHHHHASLHDICHIIDGLELPEDVKQNAKSVYLRIAEAEGHVHGRKVEEVHFHEVGTLDAVADVVSVCLLMQELAVEQVIVSPIHVGSGLVRCAHGILPVPAPATAYILRGVPIYGGQIKGELCTPTGAALIRQFAHEFGSLPLMKIEKIGYGMGRKEFPVANCVRAMLGESI
ncbi:MAG: LarC family nickel insertion protein [Lachnospiraceae bacterium]|nr:LarC family nickel insertion protein [Lachnospiraceae bacterium]